MSRYSPLTWNLPIGAASAWVAAMVTNEGGPFAASIVLVVLWGISAHVDDKAFVREIWARHGFEE